MSVSQHIKSLTSDSLIYGLSNALSKFASFLLVPLYTSVLLPSEYGIMGLITSIFSLIGLILVLNLDNSTARWFYDSDDISDRKKTINTWFWFYQLLSIIVYSIIFLFSAFFSKTFLSTDAYSLLIRLVSCSFILNVSSSVMLNILRFDRKPKSVMAFSLSQSFSLILLNYYLVAVCKKGLYGIYTSQLITSICFFFVAIILMRKWIVFPPVKCFEFDRLKKMILFSLPFFPATIAYWVINLSGLYFIKHYCNDNEVGLYQVGTSFASVIVLLTGAFQSAWGPFAYSIHKQKDAGRVYAVVADMYIVIVGFVCMITGLYAKEILILFTNEQYYPSATVISILVFNYFFIGLSYIAGIGAGIAKKNQAYGMIMFVSAVVLVGLNILLVPIFQKNGAAVATCISQAIIPFYMFYKSQQLYFIPYRLKKPFLLLLIYILILIGLYLLGRCSFYVIVSYKIVSILFCIGLIIFSFREEVNSLVSKLKLTKK